MKELYNQEPNARDAKTVKWALQQTSEVASKAPTHQPKTKERKNTMSIFNKTSKRLEKLIEEAVATSCHTASKMKTGLKGDYPVTIHCYGKAEYWDSAYLAYHFYQTGALCCEGSEAERYWRIVTDLTLMEENPELHKTLGGKDGVASDGELVRMMIMRVA